MDPLPPLAHSAMSTEPSRTACRFPAEPDEDWRSLTMTPGWRSRTRARTSARSSVPVLRVHASVTVPRTWPETAATSSLAASTASRIRWAPALSAAPCSVSATGVTLRSNSGTRSSRSSRAIALDMADWTMWALRAAAVKLPVSQHVRKYSRSRMSTASC